jgi:hypothetical protein
MSKTIHQKMHEQHVQWASDLETWVKDIDIWKRELQDAIQQISTINGMLGDALTALENHADAVWEEQQRVRAHEGVIGQEARQASSKTDHDWAATHHDESAQHERLADAHGRIKQHQHNVVAELNRLMQKMTEAM